MQKTGKLIVIDGTDGSWKKTQTELLVQRLTSEGYEVEKIDFPQYGKKSAGPTEEYLSGSFGTAAEVSPYQASVLYAVDRFSASFQIRKWLEEGKIVISDRYVSANMGHQAGKIDDLAERDRFLEWLEAFEYELLGIPCPDIQIFLYLDPEISMDKSKDIHENDAEHMRKASEAFRYVAEKYGWIQIACAEQGEMKTREQISSELYQKIASMLA